MQRLIITHDGTGEDALKQRMQEHPTLLPKTAELTPKHQDLTGGVLASNDHRMIGMAGIDGVQPCLSNTIEDDE
ncbi:MAG: hypothetical protein AAGA73_06715 [Pseudomonadota bacterium]